MFGALDAYCSNLSILECPLQVSAKEGENEWKRRGEGVKEWGRRSEREGDKESERGRRSEGTEGGSKRWY